MSRQKRIVYFFTFLGVLGLGMYLSLPQDSDFRSLGIILMIFCVPMAMREAQKLARMRTPPPPPRPYRLPLGPAKYT